jgi:hypothetical protein
MLSNDSWCSSERRQAEEARGNPEPRADCSKSGCSCSRDRECARILSARRNDSASRRAGSKAWTTSSKGQNLNDRRDNEKEAAAAELQHGACNGHPGRTHTGSGRARSCARGRPAERQEGVSDQEIAEALAKMDEKISVLITSIAETTIVAQGASK